MKFFDECPDCGSIKTTTLVEQRFDDKYLSLINESYNDIERAWVKCEKCNMIYHNPQLDEDDTKKLYSKFRDKLFREEEEDDYFERIISIPESESENYHKVQWLVGSISNKTLENSKILDVGCGGGVFLHALMKVVSSKHIFGLEPTENFARLAERKLGCTIINDNFEGIISGGEYDLITCNHVLEHSTNPKVFFDTLYANLSNDGYLYIEVPSVIDFSDKSMLKNQDRFLMQHLWYFEPKVLEDYAKKSGFNLYKMKTVKTCIEKNDLVAVFKK